MPNDWQHVGTRPEFKVRASSDQAGGDVLLYMRDDYFEQGIEGAVPVASMPLEPADEAGMLVGILAAPLPEGDYVVALKESSGSVPSLSGVCLGGGEEESDSAGFR